MRTTFLFLALAFIALAAATSLVGCGGGSQAAANGASVTGKAAFTVVWPAPSRLIPLASNSIRIEMLRGNTIIDSKLLARPSTGGQATVQFDNLPVGTLSARARALPQADGTGNAQATGSVPVTIASGQTANFILTIGTTIATISLSGQPLTVGQQGQIQVTARDSSSAVVLLTPSKLQWRSSDTSKVTVSDSGQISGLAPGTSIITVTDTESGVAGTVSITVAPGNIIFNPANGHYYTAVDTDDLIRWSQAKAAAEAMRFNGLAGHLVTITSADENNFIAAHFPGTDIRSYWAGGFQDTTAPDYSEPGGGWKWITGEPWVYANWGAGEPNSSAPQADFLNLFPSSEFNDTIDDDGHGYGYIVEFEP